MKPLACETGSGTRNNNNNYNHPIKSNFHLIGILNPGESKETKGWLIIAASTSAQLSLSDKQLHILSSFCPKKIPTDCVDCIDNNWNKSTVIKIDNEKENQNKPEIFLIPVDQTSGDIMIEDCIRLDKSAFTSGENFHFALGGISIDQIQWKTLMEILKDTETGGKSKFDNSKHETSASSTIPKSKSGSFLKWITTSHSKKLESTEENDTNKTKPVDLKYASKVKRIVSDSQGKNRITKRNKAVLEAGATRAGEAGSGIEIENELQQLIRIELKPDPGMQESSFQFCSGDLLKLKVTMYFPENFGTSLDHHLEIDLVQNFQCKTVTQKKTCRSRRITKLLKRTTVPDLKWEKGIHISGQQFALSLIPYRIPQLADEQFEGKSVNEEETDGGSEPKLDNKFKVTDFRFELQIRLYEKVRNPTCEDSQSSHVLTACSCFPLNLMSTSTSNSNHAFSQFLTSGDILQVYPDESEVEKGEGECETEKFSENSPTFHKSLSATEFDV